MKKYNDYKDSSIKWLGDIPAHWETFRFIDNVKLRHGYQFRDYDFTDEGTRVVKISQLDPKGNLNLTKSSFIASDRLNSFKSIRIYQDDILMALTGGTIGKIIRVGEISEPLLQNYRVGNFFPDKKKLNKTFLYFLLASQVTEEQINYLLNRNGQPNIGKESFKNMFFTLPPLKEQTQIANYLDTKTNLIDKKIKLLKQKIKHYKAYRKTLINETVTKGLDKTVKLKDSGIDWLGEIPEHWEVKRFKEICYKNHTGGTPSTSNTDMFRGDNIWVTIADMKKDDLVFDSKLKLTDEAIKTSNIPITPKGSLLYSFKLTLGKIAFAAKDIYTNEAIISILPNKNIVLRYHYYMLPIYLLLNATENIYGAKMLNQKLISNALLLHPTIKEQQQIAAYLDAKTSTIDDIVNNIETQIITLKELRKTLINEVVTGKVKVTA